MYQTCLCSIGHGTEMDATQETRDREFGLREAIIQIRGNRGRWTSTLHLIDCWKRGERGRRWHTMGACSTTVLYGYRSFHTASAMLLVVVPPSTYALGDWVGGSEWRKGQLGCLLCQCGYCKLSRDRIWVVVEKLNNLPLYQSLH